MPDMKEAGSGLPKEKKFINEKIVKQPMSKRKIAKRAAVFLFLAALFGIIAAVTFTISRPFAEKYMGNQPMKESETVRIPKDEETTAPEPSSAAEEKETTPVNELVKEAMENYHFDMQTVNNIYNNLRLAGQKADKSIVSVHTVTGEKDWFDNPVESTGKYAGAVIAVTDSEVLILTPEAAVKSAETIFVTLYGGIEVEGIKKQEDTVKGLAVISINKADMPEEKKESIESFKLGNSYRLRNGDMVLSVGAPAGIPYSFDYGTVNYIAKSSQSVDGTAEIMLINIKGNPETGTFILNTAGELIGWVTDKYSNEVKDSVVAEGISSYKGLLEKMTNGLPSAYIGIKVQEITNEMVENGISQGIYVAEAVPGGPAYVAGIQNGDIITKIDGKSIFTMNEFQLQVEEMEVGQSVEIVVNRNGRDNYTELKYNVLTEER